MGDVGLHISVAFTLSLLTFGVWVIHHKDQIPIESSHRLRLHVVSVLALFLSWIPVANTAWLNDREVDLIQQELARQRIGFPATPGFGVSSILANKADMTIEHGGMVVKWNRPKQEPIKWKAQ